MEKIVPLASATVKGPLGVAHLPRLWLTCALAAAGALPAGYRTGYEGTNRMLLDGLALDPGATFAYLETRPAYAAFEHWVQEHAGNLDAAAVTAVNAAVAQDGGALREALGDWAEVHAGVVARRGSKRQPIVPALSSQTAGPLGLMHLPRFWLKATLTAADALYDGWKSGPPSGFDVAFSGAVGLDLEAAIAHIHAEMPPYPAFEEWFAAHAAHASPAEISAHNATMWKREKPANIAAEERALLGLDKPDSYRPSIEMNDLVDWHTLHRQLAELSPNVPQTASKA